MASDAKVTVKVTKPTKESRLGIGITNQEFLKVTSIAEDGLLVNTDLKLGMKVETINGQAVTTAKEAIGLLKDAENQVTIEAANVKCAPQASVKKSATVAPDTSKEPADQECDGKKCAAGTALACVVAWNIFACIWNIVELVG